MDLEALMRAFHGDAVTPAGPVHSHEFTPPEVHARRLRKMAELLDSAGYAPEAVVDDDWPDHLRAAADALSVLRPPAPSTHSESAVHIARCPEHGLHGERDECFVCGGPVEQVPMVPADLDAATDRVLALLVRAYGARESAETRQQARHLASAASGVARDA
jgi:hypothetical protein